MFSVHSLVATFVNHVSKVYRWTRTLHHTLHSRFIKSRGLSSPSHLLYPHRAQEQGKFSFLFSSLSKLSFFHSFSSSSISFQRVCSSRPLFDPPLIPYPPPPPLPGPLASSLERFPESAQINECKSVCVCVCVRERGRAKEE